MLTTVGGLSISSIFDNREKEFYFKCILLYNNMHINFYIPS